MGWPTIDGADDDLIRFWRHLIMALRMSGGKGRRHRLLRRGDPTIGLIAGEGGSLLGRVEYSVSV